jgi:hypothetical protein
MYGKEFCIRCSHFAGGALDLDKVQPSLIPYHHLPILELGVFNVLNVSKPCHIKHLALLVGPGLRTNTKNMQS